MAEDNKRALQRLHNGVGRLKVAEAKADDARRELRQSARYEIESGRLTAAEVARVFGLSERRLRQLLNGK
jgi:AraC-like DNA-binding protein